MPPTSRLEIPAFQTKSYRTIRSAIFWQVPKFTQISCGSLVAEVKQMITSEKML
jgi:hypothetical protein